MKQRIVLLGPPASGKGTQAEMIREKYHIQTPSTGAILREEKNKGTPLGLEAAKYWMNGQLVPDKLIVELMGAWIAAHDGAFVLDGFPRSIGQAEALEKILDARHTPLEVALALDVNFETIAERVARRWVCKKCGNVVSVGWHVAHPGAGCPKCGGALERRADDTLEVLRQRMGEYNEKSAPLISFYEKRGILHRIDAQRPADAVFAAIDEILNAA